MRRIKKFVHEDVNRDDDSEEVDDCEANLDRLRERVTPAVAESEMGEVDVVAVHELGEAGSQKHQNLGVCEAQEQRYSNPLEEKRWHVSGNEVGIGTLV